MLYYAANVAGTADECISVATASQPQGPFNDTSTAPLACQKSLGGSIDPASFIDTNGTQYLVWKSGGPGTSRIWSQPLVPSGTSFVPGSNPTSPLAPDQPWEAGTVEAPDLVTTGGRYYLFYWATTGTVRTTRLASPRAPDLSVRAATRHRIRSCRAGLAS